MTTLVKSLIGKFAGSIAFSNSDRASAMFVSVLVMQHRHRSEVEHIGKIVGHISGYANRRS